MMTGRFMQALREQQKAMEFTRFDIIANDNNENFLPSQEQDPKVIEDWL